MSHSSTRGTCSALVFKATAAGQYFIGVAAFRNDYDPQTAGTGRAGRTGEYVLQVSVTPPRAPDAQDQSLDVDEDAAVGSVVGTIVANNPDGDPLTFTVTAGNAAGAFAVDANTGEVTTAAALDHETDDQYVLTVDVSDGGRTTTIDVTIDVDDVNEAPEAQPQSLDVDEDAAVGSVVGTIVANDPDGDPLTFTVTAGNAAGTFAVDANTGEVTTAAALDHETDDQYVLTVDVSDGGRTTTVDVTIDVDDVNEAPELQHPIDPAGVHRESKTVGYDLQEDADVFEVKATDVDDGDVITYAITAGNDEGLFHVVDVETNGTYSGFVRLADAALDAEHGTYVLTVTATDEAGLSDELVLTVSFETAVGVGGDLHAVESTGDGIELDFVRFDTDLSQALVVDYEFVWSSSKAFADDASAADFVNLPALGGPNGTSGSITIAAGETTATLALTAKTQDGNERIEAFVVNVATSAGGAYRKVSSQTTRPDASDLTVRSATEVYVLEGFTLYADKNLDQFLVDNVGQGNPGIHYNDVNQGGIGDCFAMASIAAVAKMDWTRIEDIIIDRGNGRFDVVLGPSSDTRLIELDLELDRGFDMAQLSGDYVDDVNAPDYGYAEIWTLVLEKAISEYFPGGYPNLNTGGHAHDVLRLFAQRGHDNPFGGYHETIDWSVDDFVAYVFNAGSQGRTVLLSTAGVKQVNGVKVNRPGDVNLTEGHVYLYLGNKVTVNQNTNETTIELVLFDPWGKEVRVNVDDLDGVFKRIYDLGDYFQN